MLFITWNIFAYTFQSPYLMENGCWLFNLEKLEIYFTLSEKLIHEGLEFITDWPVARFVFIDSV